MSPKRECAALGPILKSAGRSRIRRRGSRNAIGTIRQAPSFLQWLAHGAWIPSYPWLLQHLVGRSDAVVGVTVIFEAAVAAMLI
jgi:hypothetical protein